MTVCLNLNLFNLEVELYVHFINFYLNVEKFWFAVFKVAYCFILLYSCIITIEITSTETILNMLNKP